MADLILLRESREILKQMGVTQKEDTHLCSVLKVLQMRHADLDTHQAIRVVRKVLHD